MLEKQSQPREHEGSVKHPWIELLDLEQEQQSKRLPVLKNSVGRPKRRFPRNKKIAINLTEMEVDALDSLVKLIKDQVGLEVVRADLIAFMTHKLIDEITALNPNEENKMLLPDGIKSFTDLAKYLDKGFRQPPAAKSPTEKKRRKPAE